MVGNANKQKGSRWEKEVRVFLRERGVDVEALRQMGQADEGDLVVRCPRGHRVVLEAKNRQQMRLSEYLGEAKAEAVLYAKNRGFDPAVVSPVAVVKARGKPVAEGYAVLRLDDFVAVLNRL
ncbi:hypothetical protein [Schaalia sp. ZJ1691]|uniref:hypothetical protein n=1 Tax=Schaalia sp. ZJ1691 TaxID=2709404 RepID=UPI0013EB0F9B|nr:hypothetical protein [Schaalia sp. ZJ1691]